MKIVSIEPTPSPYSMKINLDEALPDGQTENYKQKDGLQGTPDYIQQLFTIHGVKGMYRVIDFLALERNPRVAWEDILPQVRDIIGTKEELDDNFQAKASDLDHHFGEIQVFIQTFRHIPMQVKLQEGDQEKRFGLPERFMNAVMTASTASDNMLKERKWHEKSPRYGNMDEIGKDVTEEISASYDQERLDNLIQLAQQGPVFDEQKLNPWKKVTLDMLDAPNWRDRYAALDRMNPTVDDLPVLDKALQDEKSSIRRLATAYLGMLEDKQVLPYLYKALHDGAVNVRRTAGDCLSDLGFKDAIPEMAATLQDKSRLVRWRAAMFLYEVGDESAIAALKEAVNDAEFEVRMQAKMALARIEDGKKAEGSIWSQMTDAVKR